MNDARCLHTFGVSAQVDHILYLTTNEDLLQVSTLCSENRPWLVCGEGSNLLFVDNFLGTVVINRLRSRMIVECPDHWIVEAGAGENWHELVAWLVDHEIGGVENLALIPGSVGAAPVQNIGAYGLEFSDLCDWVEVYDPQTQQFTRLSQASCQFGYRESIFKTSAMNHVIVTRVGMKLLKQWCPRLNYGSLKGLDPNTVTIAQVFETICQTRQAKLPDPAQIGNAGSFFKNPLVDASSLKKYLKRYPDMPHYLIDEDHYKVAAGWLIEQCGFKGIVYNGAGVHSQQALVLINRSGSATGQDVVRLASYIQSEVKKQFAVTLEPEVLFIGESGFMQPQEVLSYYAKP